MVKLELFTSFQKNGEYLKYLLFLLGKSVITPIKENKTIITNLFLRYQMHFLVGCQIMEGILGGFYQNFLFKAPWYGT